MIPTGQPSSAQSIALQVASHKSHSVKSKSKFESRTFNFESKSKSLMHKSKSKSPKSGLESYSSPSQKFKYYISASSVGNTQIIKQ